MYQIRLFCFLLLCFAETTVSQKPPHVIFVLADDMGWNDVSFHGMNEIFTPNLDTLAAAGVVLNNYYVQPICTPSRGALMTGLYPVRTGLQHLVFYDSTPDFLPLQYVLLPERMKQKGYTTRLIGKWHLGFAKRNFTPTFRGFDSHYGYWSGSTDYFQKTSSEVLPTNNIQNLPPDIKRNGTDVFVGLDWRDNMRPMSVNNNEYVTDLFSKKTVDVIMNHNTSKPLFLYLAHLAVHRSDSLLPIRTPQRYIRGFEFIRDKSRRHFAGKLKALDLAIGEMMEALLKARMLQDTLIIFSSDNGASISGPWANGGSNWPLRGQKNTNFEGAIRVPAFVWSPLLKNTPRISNHMMHIVDWLPTIYAAAGGDVQDLGEIDGLNLWPSLANDVPSPRNGFLVNIDPIINTRGIRQGEWKLVKSDATEPAASSWFGPTGHVDVPRRVYPCNSKTLNVLRTFCNNNTLTYRTKLKPLDCGKRPSGDVSNCSMTPCLFNIEKDPCEYQDLSGQFPEKVAELEATLQGTRTVSPRHSPSDYNAHPIFHDGVWIPWLDNPTDSKNQNNSKKAAAHRNTCSFYSN